MDWRTFFSVFGLVFVAELGDKTQLAVVTQTCKCRRPWAVFAGASVALSAVTALGVLGGQTLGYLIPRDLLSKLAALSFVLMGVLIAREASMSGGDFWSEDACRDACGNPGPDPMSGAANPGSLWHAAAATFGLLFLAELGDKTQLAVLSLASRKGDAWFVLSAGVAALTVVTAVGVIGGRALCKLVPQRLLLWVSAALFVTMGILMGFGVL